MTYVLGIHDSHNSTACLLKDGHIESCVSEERFNRIKNFMGPPAASIKYILDYSKISPEDLDIVVLPSKIFALIPESEQAKKTIMHPLMSKVNRIMSLLPDSWYIKFYKILAPLYFGGIKNRRKLYSDLIGVDEDKIIFMDHHLSHAYTAFYGSGFDDNFLVLTLDGGGDSLCGSINVIENGDIRKIAEIPYIYSLGILYLEITRYLGMKPNEHEYKVMGLAPYASPEGTEKSYNVLKNFLRFDEKSLGFFSKIKSPYFGEWIRKTLYLHRFDWIAGAVQKLTEDVTVAWVRKAIEKTGIRDVALAGGVFMNVKLNLQIMNMKEIRKFFIFPSCGDESLAIGGAYYGYEQLCKDEGKKCNIEPIRDLYFGPSYTNEEVECAVSNKPGIKYRFVDDIEEATAELLSKGEVVARLSGRMEWGARALGNRSILTDASNHKIVKIINDIIKQRDFWMPFAPSIIKEWENEYVVNPKKVPAPYMILAFDSTERARNDLIAAMHPYDFTIRPQILEKGWNEKYHRIIKVFSESRSMGGVLNTSFNLHGFPIVCSPEDALHVLKNSELKYLTLENFLIEKK